MTDLAIYYLYKYSKAEEYLCLIERVFFWNSQICIFIYFVRSRYWAKAFPSNSDCVLLLSNS